MKRNKGFTYASMVALICVISLLWVSLAPHQVFAADKSTGINTTEGAKQSPLPPDWKVKNFPTGKSTITPNIENQLMPVLDYYKANPKDLLIVQPWVSDLKYAKNNYERQNQLAKDRGMEIREYLVSHGVPRDHIVILYMYGISLEPGGNFSNQQVTVWHATHPELSQNNGGNNQQIFNSDPKTCDPQEPCVVPPEPLINVNIPDCATKTVNQTRDDKGNKVITITVNVDKCTKEIIKEVDRGNWCQAHKAGCTALIIGGIAIIGTIFAVGCAKGATGPNGSGGNAGFCF